MKDEEEESKTGCEIPAQPTHFAALKTVDDVQQAKAAAVLKEASRDTQWCVKFWKTWTKERNAQTTEKIPEDIITLFDNTLQHLSVFILEARKTDGAEYTLPRLSTTLCVG